MDKNKGYISIRIWERSVRKLRMIYAVSGESMVSILDRIIDQEFNRVVEGEDHKE